MIAASCCHPIDTIKIRLQLQKPLADGTKKYKGMISGIGVIAKEEGVRHGVYRGIESALLRESIYSTLRLGMYEPIKRATGVQKDSGLMYKFMAGSLSGLIASGIANPMDLLKVRMQAHQGESQSFKWHVDKVYTEYGLKGFYRGVGPTMLRAMLGNGSKLGVYDWIKHKIIALNVLPDGVAIQGMSSVFATLVQAIVTCPVDNIKTRIMNQQAGGIKYGGIVQCVGIMWRSEGGFVAFYRGIGPTWARFAPFTTIQMICWEQMRRFSGLSGI